MHKVLYILMLLSVMHSCKKPYSPVIDETANTILVVEGTIAAGVNAENTFLLSRLRPLQDTTLNDPESGASVIIESQNGSSYALNENERGIYRAGLTLPATDKYRLKISTRNGRQYQSEFLEVKKSPPIDSLTWVQDGDVRIFLHTHDPSNNTRFYKWEFTETWEYHAFFDTDLKFVNGRIVFRDSSELTFACWSSATGGSIILGNTTSLSEDRVSFQPILTLPNPSPKASFKYSVLVRQIALTEDAFKFWNILRKNTELTGTLFDPQPSQLPGNIVSLNDPAEKVIGYISAGAVTEKRLYIRNAELVSWPQRPSEDSVCKVVDADPNSLEFLSQDTTYGPAFYVSGGGLRLAKKTAWIAGAGAVQSQGRSSGDKI